MQNDPIREFIYSLNRALDFRKFFLFSWFIYPLAITINLIPLFFWEESKLIRFAWLIASYIVFAILNFIWSQRKFHFTLIFLSVILGLIWMSFILNGFNSSKPLEIFSAIMLYPIMLPVFLLSQLTAWTPAVIKLTTLHKTPFFVTLIILSLSILAYAALGLLTQTIVQSISFQI